MDQIDSGGGDSQNTQKRGIFRNAQTYIILAIIVIAAIIYFSTKGDNQNQNISQNSDNQTNDEQSAQTNDNISERANDENPQAEADNASSSEGNVSAVGTLRNSDNPARGNLMIESQSGKIYIATVRDFSAQLDKQVTLQASGTLNRFVFLGLAEANTDTTARGGAEETPTNDVSFSGKLQNSDNQARGNYIVVSSNTKVYLKSARDYSSLIDSEVNLTATGTLNSFTNALVTKK